jgi:hypothetical protein
MLNFGEVNSRPNIDKLGFDACSLSSLTWEKDMLRDDFTQFIVEKDNALYFMESNILSFIFVLWLAQILMFILHILK